LKVSARACAAEAIGTALLLASVVGSGIMGERLSGGNAAIALLANSIATGCALYALIVTFAGISGAHFNPLVTIVARLDRAIGTRDAVARIGAQIGGAVAGAWLAHAMFELPIWLPSAKVRAGAGQWLAEAVATFGLILCVRLVAPRGVPAIAGTVATYITAAYWFTASTSFANPAVTLARSLTDTFAGIRYDDAPPFMVAQCVGAALGYLVSQAWLGPSTRPR
jgi:glycerol uptake facilitator-like aquaporin